VKFNSWLHQVLVMTAGTLLLVSCSSEGAASSSRILELLPRTPAQIENMQSAVEDHVAECMAESGFAYVRSDSGRSRTDESNSEYSDLSYATEFGFGFVNSPRSPVPETEASSSRDFASPEERLAYDEALLGPSGCGPAAFSEIFGPMQALMEQLSEPLEEIEARVSADPEFVDARQLFSNCLANSGYPGIRDRGELRSVFEAEFQSVMDGATQTVRQSSQPTLDEIAAVMETQEVRQFAEREIAAATALVECENEHLANTYQRLFLRHERDVLKDYPQLDLPG